MLRKFLRILKWSAFLITKKGRKGSELLLLVPEGVHRLEF